MKKCLIFLDRDHMKDSINLLEIASLIYREDCETYGIIFSGGTEEANGYFNEMIYIVSNKMNPYDARSMAAIMALVHETYQFDCILFPASWVGRMLAPRLAVRLGSGLTADVTEIRMHGNEIEMIRPAYGGRIMAGISNTGSGPVMMSVRAGVFHVELLHKKQTKETYLNIPSTASGFQQITSIKKDVKKDIRDSRVLVSGGGGIAGGFQQLEILAKLLNGQTAASRKLVDMGLVPRSIQVGQSGKTVRPDLYMAFGIHGSMQHMEGIQNVKNLITINRNNKAPICSISDIVVEGDAEKFAQMLIQKINKSEQKTTEE